MYMYNSHLTVMRLYLPLPTVSLSCSFK
jgi:hypothetical protein